MKMTLPPSIQTILTSISALFRGLAARVRLLAGRLRRRPALAPRILATFGSARRAFRGIPARRKPGEARPARVGSLRQTSLQTRLIGGFLVVLGMFSVAAIVAVLTQNRLTTAGEAVNHSHLVMEQSNQVMLGLVNMETGYRGFLLTGQDGLLDSYHLGREQVQAALAKMLELTAGDDEQQARLQSVQKQAQRWEMDWMKKGVDLRRRMDMGLANIDDIGAYEARSQAATVMQDVQALLAEVIQAENARLETRLKSNSQAAALARGVLMGGALASIFFGLGFAILFARSVTRSLETIAAAASRLAEGRLEAAGGEFIEANITRRGDEVGQVGRGLNAIAAYLGEMAHVSDQVASGDLTMEIKPRSGEDELGLALARMLHSLRRLVGQTRENATALTTASGELAQSAHNVSAAVEQIAGALQLIAGGAARQTRSVNQATQTLSAMNAAIRTVSGGVNDQNQAVAQAATVAVNISAAVQRVGQNAGASSRAAAEAAEAAVGGAGAGSAAMQTMQAIQSRVSKTSEKVQEMKLLSEQIGVILETMQDIAAQTNLLALNAAIEAAHAGRYGAGFAVVADEVRKLADRSSASAKEIAALIQSIQTTAGEAVAAMDASAREVQKGVGQTGNFGQSLEAIQHAAETVRVQVQAITAAAEQAAAASDHLDGAMETVETVMQANAQASRQMAAGAGEVNLAVEEIANVSEQNAAAVEEVSVGVEEITAQAAEVSQAAGSLSGLAQALLDGVSLFRISSFGGENPRREASDEEILAALNGEIILPPPPIPYLGPDRRAGLAERIEQGLEPPN